MELKIEKIKDLGRKSQAVLLSIGLGVSAAIGATLIDDNPVDNNPVKKALDADQAQDAPKEISAQIDENKNKLESLSSSSSKKKTDYTLIGC